MAMIGGAGELKDGGWQAGSTQSMLRSFIIKYYMFRISQRTAIIKIFLLLVCITYT